MIANYILIDAEEGMYCICPICKAENYLFYCGYFTNNELYNYYECHHCFNNLPPYLYPL